MGEHLVGSAMASSSKARSWALLALVAGGVVACNLVLDIRQGELAAGGASSSTSSTSSTTSQGGGGSGAGGGDVGGSSSSTGGSPQCPSIIRPSPCQPGTESDADNCCVAGRSCDGAGCSMGTCLAVEYSPPPVGGAEAIGIAVIGDELVWSSGYGDRLWITKKAGGDTVYELVEVTANSYVTYIEADDDHVYFLDYGGPKLRRVPAPAGVIQDVSLVMGGEAGFGRLAITDTYVYWAMATSGGIWRANKDLSDALGAEPVSADTGVYGVAADDTHVYWGVNGGTNSYVYRLPHDDLTAPPELIIDHAGTYIGAMTVDEQYLYYRANGELRRAAKQATNVQVLPLASNQGTVWDIEVDDAFVYWTDSDGYVARTRKDGSEDVEVLASGNTPWGLTQDCDTIYWADTGAERVYRNAK